jgi:ribosomal protein L34E
MVGLAMPPPNKRRTVRKVRSPHGTRVARRIVCRLCGAEDRIDFAPKDPEQALCRKCAYEALSVDDPDRSELRGARIPCERCGAEFVQINDEHLQCSDCHRGIETNRDHKVRRAARVSDRIVRVERKKS